MMTQDKDQQLARLKSILGLYGADSQKWPEAERQGLLGLVSTDSDAKLLLEDGKALEVCLNAAAENVGAAELSGLASKIMAQAAADVQSEMQSAALDTVRDEAEKNVEQKPFTEIFLAGLFWLKSQLLDGRQFAGQHMTSLSLLSACLLLGVLIGINESLGSYLQQGFQLAFFDGLPGSDQSLEEVLLGTEIL